MVLLANAQGTEARRNKVENHLQNGRHLHFGNESTGKYVQFSVEVPIFLSNGVKTTKTLKV